MLTWNSNDRNGLVKFVSAMKLYLYRVCWVRPYYALLLSLGLCVLTVVLSLLYLEDAALKLPHTRLQAAPHIPTFSPALPIEAGRAEAIRLADRGGGVRRKEQPAASGGALQKQVWPDRKKDMQSDAGVGSLMNRPNVKVLNSLEIVAQNLSHTYAGTHMQKESERLGIVYKDGSLIIPPHLLAGPPLNASHPARKRYIIYLCHNNITCCGWGDRQHGVLSAYLISVVTNRTFGVDMSSPCPMATLFHPRIIDWKVNTSSLVGLTSRHIYTVNDKLFRQVMQTINFDAVYTEDVIYLTTNYDYFYALKANPHYTRLFRRKMHGKPRPMVFADLWQNVFKLNKRVRRRIDRALKLARPTPHHKLVCGHVRLGKNPSIPNDSEVRNTMQSIKPLWNFLAHFKDPKKYRIFVPSDSDLVRTKVLDMFPGQAVDIKGEIMHVDKSQVEDACMGFEKVLADQYLLATCDVLVLTYSVFGKSAAYMRRSNHDLYFMENGTIKPLQLFKE